MVPAGLCGREYFAGIFYGILFPGEPRELAIDKPKRFHYLHGYTRENFGDFC